MSPERICRIEDDAEAKTIEVLLTSGKKLHIHICTERNYLRVLSVLGSALYLHFVYGYSKNGTE